MASPPLVLALLLILLSTFIFHACFGRTARGLLVLFVAALGGFLAGEIVARALAPDWGKVGPVHVAYGLLGAWVVMALARRRVA